MFDTAIYETLRTACDELPLQKLRDSMDNPQWSKVSAEMQRAYSDSYNERADG